jgi:hypothetical protein
VQTEAALNRIAAMGGPAGWQSISRPDLANLAGQREAQHEGMPVVLNLDGDVKRGFTVSWTTSEASDDACSAVATWAARLVQEPREADFRDGCVAVIRSRTVSPGLSIMGTGATPFGPEGRYLVGTAVAPSTESPDQLQLFAAVEYEVAP